MALILSTTGNKRDYVKASVTTNTMQELEGKEFEVDAAIMYTKEEAGDEITVSCIRMKDSGNWYSSISGSVASSLETICDAMKEEFENGTGVVLTVNSRQSKNNRKFIWLDLV